MPELRQKVDRAVLSTLLRLPERAVRVLAGTPVDIEGQRFSPELQLMLRLQRVFRIPPAESLPWDRARAELGRQSWIVGGHQPIGAVRDLLVDGDDGKLPARLYTPASRLMDAQVPTLMFFHGGGMVYGGDNSTHDLACRHLAERSGVQVLSVDYRLAPEHPFPAGVEDAAAAYRWLVEHAADLDADPERLAVGGDSAGGYLAATTAIRAADLGLPLRFQLLVYPVTDFVEQSASRRRFCDGFFLTSQFMDQATDAFLPEEKDRHDPMASLVHRTSFPAGLAPAYVVTAGFDPLRDEGEAYAQLLAEHGVTVELRRYPSMMHGFFNIVGVGREVVGVNQEIADKLASSLG